MIVLALVLASAPHSITADKLADAYFVVWARCIYDEADRSLDTSHSAPAIVDHAFTHCQWREDAYREARTAYFRESGAPDPTASTDTVADTMRSKIRASVQKYITEARAERAFHRR